MLFTPAGSWQPFVGPTPPASFPLIFPGSFNPFHHGHQQMADCARQKLHAEAVFELSIDNVDKPPLGTATIQRRLEQLLPHGPVLLTRLAQFVQKARCFRDTTFLVGADTVTRIDDCVYYAGDRDQRERSLAELASLGCRFLVFGRKIGPCFSTAESLALSPRLRALCLPVSEREFRADVSSRHLRRSIRP